MAIDHQAGSDGEQGAQQDDRQQEAAGTNSATFACASVSA